MIALMKQSHFLSGIYILGQVFQGLLLHPYQTMQDLVTERVFSWLAWLPTVILALFTVLWRFGIVPVVRTVVSCQVDGFWGCQLVVFGTNWVTFFVLFWQVLLLYLLIRFKFFWLSETD